VTYLCKEQENAKLTQNMKYMKNYKQEQFWKLQ